MTIAMRESAGRLRHSKLGDVAPTSVQSVPYVERRGGKVALGPHGIDALGEPGWDLDWLMADPQNWDELLALLLDDR